MKQIMNYVKQMITLIHKAFQRTCMTTFGVLSV